jgi:hypothetical protein
MTGALTKKQYFLHGWLDSVAVGMSLLCAVHCLITPLVMVALPILSTTLWSHQNFHLWMMLFVLPTTSFAIFLGCRKHKDKLVFVFGALGLSLLLGVAVYESFASSGLATAGDTPCGHCLSQGADRLIDPRILTNLLGGLLLVSGHVRNFHLCRRHRCEHNNAEL